MWFRLWEPLFIGSFNDIEHTRREHLVPDGTQPLKWSGYPHHNFFGSGYAG